jgi:hypothetical protein
MKYLFKEMFHFSLSSLAQKLKKIPKQVTIKNRMISPFQFAICAGHSYISGLRLRLEPSTDPGLSNEPKYVKIGRLKPEF